MKRLPMLLFAMLGVVRAGAADLPLERIRLPAGFTVSLFAGDVPGARSLALGDRGTLFVGTRGRAWCTRCGTSTPTAAPTKRG